MKKRVILMTCAAGMIGGCSTLSGLVGDDYRLGDGLRGYCEATTPEVRDIGRDLAEKAGATLPDLCAAAGLILVPLYEEVEGVDGE